MMVARACALVCFAASPWFKIVLATRLVHEEPLSTNATGMFDGSRSRRGSRSAAEEEDYDQRATSESDDDAKARAVVEPYLEDIKSDLKKRNPMLWKRLVGNFADDFARRPGGASSDLHGRTSASRDGVLGERWVPDTDSFKQALREFDSRFGLEEDLGYSAWHRDCPSRSPNQPRARHSNVQVGELRCGFGARGPDPRDWGPVPYALPPRLVNIDRIRDGLPIDFPFRQHHSMPLGFVSGLPHEPPPVASLYVASQRFDISTVSFFIGGSALYTLATGDLSGKQFTVQRSRGIIMIQTNKDYFVDLTNRGFQFERLLTGHAMHSIETNAPHFEHMCVLRIANFTVLVSANVDAVDERQRPVEITTASEPYSERIMFQLMSLASVRLQHRRVYRDTLKRIDEYTLREIFGTQSHIQLGILADNLVLALRAIAAEWFAPLSDLGQSHVAGAPKLIPLSTQSERALLPGRDVLAALFRT